MNKVILMGRLTKDPALYGNPGDNSFVARYSIAIDRRGRGRSSSGQDADFVEVVAFGPRAMFAEKYLKKGTSVAVIGSVRSGSYVNKDGQRVYTQDIVVEDQEFAGSKNRSSEETANIPETDPALGTMNDRDLSTMPGKPSDLYMPDVTEEELPFMQD